MPGIDDNTLLMLHFDDLLDVSPFKRELTNYGVSISQEKYKFFGKSAKIANGYLSVPASEDWAAGSITLDFWIYYNSQPSGTNEMALLGTSTTSYLTYYSGELKAYLGTIYSFGSLSIGAWHHIALVFTGTIVQGYVDGVKKFEDSRSAPIFNSSSPFIIGAIPRTPNEFFTDGYIQELRISNVARWTSDFEPPTEPYSPENVIEVTLPRENGRTTFCRQFTYNPQGEYNSRRDGAIVSGMPVAGLLVNNLPNGTLINIPENSSPVLFYKAKSDYESSLNGAGRTLVVRKDTYDDRVWDRGNVNAYASSDLDSWFNSTYKNMLDADIRSLIGTTKIRYTPGNGNWTVGTLERAVFALSATELGQSASWFNVEGSALPIASTLRIAYRNGSANTQWTRSPDTDYKSRAVYLNSYGGDSRNNCSGSNGSRPCFTLPATAMVDPTPNPDGSYNLIY